MANPAENVFLSSVNLSLFHGTGSIWNVKEWKKLRRHRVVGSLVGTVAQQQHQIKENGFPLLLTKNETTLLLEEHLAILWDCSHLLDKPTEETQLLCNAQRNENIETQRELLMQQRKIEIMERANLIVEGKLAKRRKLDPTLVVDEEEEKQIIQEELSKVAVPSDCYLCIQTCTEDPWSTNNINQAKWTYPVSDDEKLEYATFKKLWEMGFWITPGSKFGGKFLAYPGDPLLYHANYIVQVVEAAAKMSPLDIVAQARLANSTKKTALIAYFDKKMPFDFVRGGLLGTGYPTQAKSWQAGLENDPVPGCFTKMPLELL